MDSREEFVRQFRQKMAELNVKSVNIEESSTCVDECCYYPSTVEFLFGNGEKTDL